MSLETLYPFLYQRENSADASQECLGSCLDKMGEIVQLRTDLERLEGQLFDCAADMAARLRAGAQVVAFGNGGSSTDAQGVAALFSSPPFGRPFPALALNNDVAVITALSNDVGFEVSFARPLAALARSGDIAIGISTSGSSENVLTALAQGRQRRMLTIGMAGSGGGRMAGARLDYLFTVPSSAVPRIQEVHTTIYHLLWNLIQKEVDNADSN